MFLPEIIIHGPHNVFCRLGSETKQFIFETVGGLDLIGAVYYPIVQRKTIADGSAHAHTHVVKGQKIKPVRARIIYLVLGVVALDTERTSPFAEIDGYAFTGGNYVGAIGLENVAIDLWSRFVGGISLQGIGGLAELQVEAPAPAMACCGIGQMVNDETGLVEAELIAEHVVGAQQIYSADGIVEIVGIVAIERYVDGRLTEKT